MAASDDHNKVATVTLRALYGEPLAEPAIESMVVATASAIAEREGVEIAAIETDAASITVSLVAHRLAAIGFAAELRRLTTRWYTAKYDALTLWGDPLRPEGAEAFDDEFDYDDEDDGENWLGDPDAWKHG